MTKEPALIEREQLEEMLRIAPFHQWLGVEIKSHSADQLQLLMPWRNEIVSNPMLGAAHGGVLAALIDLTGLYTCLLYTSPSPRDQRGSRMPSSA